MIGSGAAGGMTALVLCKAGAKVLMLEAGADFDTARDSKMFMRRVGAYDFTFEA